MKARRSDKARGQIFAKFNHDAFQREMTLLKKKEIEKTKQSLGEKLIGKVKKIFKISPKK